MAMSNEKIRDAFLECERYLAQEASKLGVTMAIRDAKADTRHRRVSHLKWMIQEGLKLVADERREKAMRWLGFVQCAVSWGLDLCTIDQLKEMNRPDDSEFDGTRV